MEAVEAARDLVSERFPDARAALLAGSSARGGATATSDLDVVVLLPGSGRSFRETVRTRGQLAELFVYTDDEVRRWWQRDAAEHRNTLADMCATGLVLVDDGCATALQEAAVRFIAGGPPAPTTGDLERRRYVLTDAVDDLAGGGDAEELAVLAGLVVVWTCELALLSRGAWLGTDKWLLRRVRQLDPALAEEVGRAHRRAVADGDRTALIRVVDGVLDQVGGRLGEGYRAGHLPPAAGTPPDADHV